MNPAAIHVLEDKCSDLCGIPQGRRESFLVHSAARPWISATSTFASALDFDKIFLSRRNKTSNHSIFHKRTHIAHFMAGTSPPPSRAATSSRRTRRTTGAWRSRPPRTRRASGRPRWRSKGGRGKNTRHFETFGHRTPYIFSELKTTPSFFDQSSSTSPFYLKYTFYDFYLLKPPSQIIHSCAE